MDLAVADRDRFVAPDPRDATPRAPGVDEPVLGPRGEVLIADPATPPPFVADLARARVTVLVTGETGVGKELLAHALHAGRGPFVAINCAAIAPSLLESELFGHVAGAFTGATQARVGLLESARGGTVFLDEIGELSLALQAKLLRVLEAREVLPLGAVRPVAIDARFVAATHRDLAAEVRAGRFRADLFYRLDGITLAVAPLRADPARIDRLARRFVREAGSVLAGCAAAQLRAHTWPGNVRELKAVCTRAALLARGGAVTATHVAFAPAEAAASPRPGFGADGLRMRATGTAPPPAIVPLGGGPSDGGAAAERDPGATTDPPILAFLTPAQRAERVRIVAALAACAGNQRRAAALIGMSRTAFIVRLRLYRVPRPRC